MTTACSQLDLVTDTPMGERGRLGALIGLLEILVLTPKLRERTKGCPRR